MKTTLSVIKADIGSVGGHIVPSRRLEDSVASFIGKNAHGLLEDYAVSHTGDDIAILMAHHHGKSSEAIHRLAWNAFQEGTREAREEGLYGAGQDILVDSFTGNVHGLGPAVAEIEFEERPNEPFLFFAADKTDPGAFNLPLYLSFADPMNTPGLLLSPKMGKGFRFVIMDVSHTTGDRVIELNAPEDLYAIATLLRDPERYVVESVWSRSNGEQSVAVATSRLHNIAGKYTGKDDPVMLVRVQMHFPAAGEILAPYAVGHLVGGGMRGSHNMPLMPVPRNTGISYFDGPPVVSCSGYCVHGGKLTEPVDAFAHPFWDTVREQVSHKAMEMRRQGFFGAAMLPMTELEYTGIVENLHALDRRFQIRGQVREKQMDTVF